MPDVDPPPRIDWRLITFPTDRVTVGQLRQRQPEILNGRVRHPSNADSIELWGTMWLEQSLAERAFAKSAGLLDPDPNPIVDQQEAIRILNDEYCSYGLSAGLHQTRQFVSEFEAAAAQQGRVARNRSR